jgi:hypothetical protein
MSLTHHGVEHGTHILASAHLGTVDITITSQTQTRVASGIYPMAHVMSRGNLGKHHVANTNWTRHGTEHQFVAVVLHKRAHAISPCTYSDLMSHGYELEQLRDEQLVLHKGYALFFFVPHRLYVFTVVRLKYGWTVVRFDGLTVASLIGFTVEIRR